MVGMVAQSCESKKEILHNSKGLNFVACELYLTLDLSQKVEKQCKLYLKGDAIKPLLASVKYLANPRASVHPSKLGSSYLFSFESWKSRHTSVTLWSSRALEEIVGG